ncbi:hypothetical protein A2662_01265 [Candidatus Giovannonibacteria bacterium RIFCSPHIGHO2_01_FULL_45_33]|uniref:Uncharacterized protein n=1 Tax=Candidatus Giovannonibacteria bacterium RIFCSPLOWO2_01_FULL_45_34 TaxID=1798351 RepID=A0A1F5X0B8_9BACT|nr:MAG: hypothetical protein A2662_01265 [Candidatus Giovannonibacteria bacterium RIFCSPHIGHO2_01_FULL_45_33]OGF69224.1 MAG: hypothetical protein A3C73_00470 [Candidatus Giovannonibacteria bacterium RIFCSPHIGHO2_02_FULL_44_11]OGF81011.1 MAG: hypothetical protein A2930_00125 [Candidatus Giovannonibacteria bacterium RIFCSPLOWO2_01_FULL_45_34]
MAINKQDLESIRGVIKEEISPLVKDVAELKPLIKDVAGLKLDMVVIKKDVAGLKLDIGLVKQDIREIKADLSGLREQIQQLTVTLDKFVKAMTDYKEEFTILKAEVDLIKKTLQEKLGVKIAVQG